jgi:hypothetical protein
MRFYFVFLKNKQAFFYHLCINQGSLILSEIRMWENQL